MSHVEATTCFRQKRKSERLGTKCVIFNCEDGGTNTTASVIRRKQGLGIPIHIAMSLMFANANWSSLLVLDINCIDCLLIAYYYGSVQH